MIATIHDIAKILQVEDDNIGDSFSCEKGELIQFILQQTASNYDQLKVFVDKEDNRIVAYIIVINCVVYPISDYVFIAHAYSKGRFESNVVLFDEVVKWAYDCGATKIQMATKFPDVFKRYGFVETEERLMEYNIDNG